MTSTSMYFPPVDCADEDGLLAIGGGLTPDWLIDAYTHGIFPWPCDEKYPMLWFSPDPRTILPLDSAHFSRRLLRRIRKGDWLFSTDEAFEAVMCGCAAPRPDEEGTWITPQIIRAYVQMYLRGAAHSVEVWRVDESGKKILVGGTYGVAIGRFFAAESKFHTETDASKAALWKLVQILKEKEFQLLDVQLTNDHLKQFGVLEIPRQEYLQRLEKAIDG